MKATFGILLLVVIIAGLFLYWQYTVAKDQLKYAVNHVELTPSNLSGVVSLNIYVDVYNPTLLDLSVDSMFGTIALNGNTIGTAVMPNPQKVIARATSTLVCTLSINVLSLLGGSSLNNFFSGTLNFNGTLSASLYGLGYSNIPIQFSTNIKDLIP